MRTLQFHVTLVALLVSLFASVCGAIKFVNSQVTVVAGQPYELEWTDAQGSVTINLMSALEGGQTNLRKVLEVVSGYSGDSYSWTPPTDLASGIYTFEISDSSGSINYSLPWSFQALPPSLTTSAKSSSTSATATATTSASASATPKPSSALGNSARLSTGAIVGIAVGASLAILGLLG